MTKALDAATRAYCEYDEQLTNCPYPKCKCDWQRNAVRAALRAALPAEFDAEKEALMRKAYGDAASTGSNPHLAVYRVLRAHLLGEGSE